MKISGERLLSDLNNLKTFTDTPDNGVTRFSYGESDRKAKVFLRQAAEAEGFSVRTDPIGNMYISCSGEGQKIRVGSHMDTVRNGGWLDGIYGVVSGLEVLRTLAREQHSRAAEVEVVIFAEEEGSNFGSTMTGSKFIAGLYGEKELDLLKNDEGSSLRDMLLDCGYPPYRKEEVIWDFNEIRAMLELHIEQGPVLEQEEKSIGIVDAIYGMKTSKVTIKGVGNHAGATPMRYRQDALVTAAHCISAVERIAKTDPEGIVVATVGKVSVFPNCSNVIPEEVVFTVEVREKWQEIIEQVQSEIEEEINNITAKRGTTCAIELVAESSPFRMDPALTALAGQLAEEAEISHQVMDSGAVHDTCVIAPHVPSCMLFVPSIGGRSHVPFEDTNPEDLVRGAQLLLDMVINL